MTKLYFNKYKNWTIINSQKKNVNNSIKIIVDKIAKTYNINNKIDKTNKKNMIIFKIRDFKAIPALQKLCFYKKQNNNKNIKYILCIN